MFKVRGLFLGGGIAVFVLAIVGGVWNSYRESNSHCSNPFYMDMVHAEMRKQMLDTSGYLKALEDGASSDLVSSDDQRRYTKAAAALRDAIGTSKIEGRMKHPSNSERVNCHLSLRFASTDALAGSDLPMDSFLGIPVDRKFEMVARFEVRFEEIDGVTLVSNIEKQRSQFLVRDIEADEVVESVPIAKMTRRQFTLHEPSFPEINYNTSFVSLEPIDAGWIGK